MTSPGIIPLWVLRAQVANDEALLEHYQRVADEIEPGEPYEPGLIDRIKQVQARLPLRRAALAQLLSTDAASSPHGAGRPASAVAGPAAPAPNATLAGALVTTAAQPGISS